MKSTKSLGSTAGRLFIEEAGGKITNVNGEPRKDTDTMLASNGLVHEQILNIIKENIASLNEEILTK